VTNSRVAEKALLGSTDVGLMVSIAWYSFQKLWSLFYSTKTIYFVFHNLWSDLFLFVWFVWLKIWSNSSLKKSHLFSRKLFQTGN